MVLTSEHPSATRSDVGSIQVQPRLTVISRPGIEGIDFSSVDLPTFGKPVMRILTGLDSVGIFFKKLVRHVVSLFAWRAKVRLVFMSVRIQAMTASLGARSILLMTKTSRFPRSSSYGPYLQAFGFLASTTLMTMSDCLNCSRSFMH